MGRAPISRHVRAEPSKNGVASLAEVAGILVFDGEKKGIDDRIKAGRDADGVT